MALGWAIISTGNHPNLQIAPAITGASNGELVAVYSRDMGRAQAFAEKHGAQAAYSDLDALLADSRIDAAFISSPNSVHAQHGITAARAGKHLMVEKPMTTTLNDALDLVRSCKNHNVKLGVGFELRHHPGHIDVRKNITDGVLGEITLANAQWGFGVRGEDTPAPRTGLREWWGQPDLIGGAAAMMGTGVHAVDLLRFLLGQEVVEVSAITDGQNDNQPLETMAATTLRFDRGALATVCCGRSLPDSRNDFTLYGTLGRATGRATLWEAQQGRVSINSDTANLTRSYSSQYLGNFTSQIEEFAQAIEEDRDPAATGIDGLRVAEITLAMIDSAREGRSIKISPAQI